jgi:cytochrome c biogenesis protein CcdA
LSEKAKMLDTFILGLSSGSTCLLTCGMVIFPYLMAGSAGSKKIIADLSFFLLTRMVVYFILATLAWYFGKAIFTSAIFRNYISGILYILFAIMLVWYSISRTRKPDCPAKIVTTVNNKKLVPVLLGVVNSLGFCPALLLILTKSATQGSLVQSYLAFLAFFAGSSLYFLPLPLAGRIKRKKVFETVGILATGLAGIVFIIKGITNLIGGIING